MAFSAGFHPHPKIGYANAASTGTASEAEYFEISVTQRVDPESVRVALDEALPPGIDVLTVVEAAARALADRLEGERLAARVRRPRRAHAPVRGRHLVGTRHGRGHALDEVGSAHLRRAGRRAPAVVQSPAEARDDTAAQLGPAHVMATDCAILRMVVRHTTPARPDDILTALREIAEARPPRPLGDAIGAGTARHRNREGDRPVVLTQSRVRHRQGLPTRGSTAFDHGAAPSANRFRV